MKTTLANLAELQQKLGYQIPDYDNIKNELPLFENKQDCILEIQKENYILQEYKKLEEFEFKLTNWSQNWEKLKPILEKLISIALEKIEEYKLFALHICYLASNSIHYNDCKVKRHFNKESFEDLKQIIKELPQPMEIKPEIIEISDNEEEIIDVPNIGKSEEIIEKDYKNFKIKIINTLDLSKELATPNVKNMNIKIDIQANTAKILIYGIIISILLFHLLDFLKKIKVIVE